MELLTKSQAKLFKATTTIKSYLNMSRYKTAKTRKSVLPDKDFIGTFLSVQNMWEPKNRGQIWVPYWKLQIS